MLSVPARKIPAQKALIGYLPQSYSFSLDHPNFIGHSNFQECRALIEILCEQGYACDIVDWQEDVSHLQGAEYDLFIGLHQQLAYGKSLVKKNGKVIFYATSAHWQAHNFAELTRLVQLKNRKNIVLLPKRQLPPVLFEDQIDEIWYLGNDFQRATFAHIKVPTYRIHISTITVPHSPVFFSAKAQKNFLWYGSFGAVHKGLDWLLDIFCRNPGLSLHVCGLVELEDDFMRVFQEALFHLPNIHFHGWVLPTSGRFREICEQCAFVVSPSASEGGGGAMLQCMGMGLVPIGTQGCSVDLVEAGFKINRDCIEETEKVMQAVVELSPDVMHAKAQRAYQVIQAKHTLAAYKSSIAARIAAI